MSKLLPCPTCKTPIEWSVSNPYRPFCSERCKLADLGSWLSGDYRIPVADDAASDPLLSDD